VPATCFTEHLCTRLLSRSSCVTSFTAGVTARAVPFHDFARYALQAPRTAHFAPHVCRATPPLHLGLVSLTRPHRRAQLSRTRTLVAFCLPHSFVICYTRLPGALDEPPHLSCVAFGHPYLRLTTAARTFQQVTRERFPPRITRASHATPVLVTRTCARAFVRFTRGLSHADVCVRTVRFRSFGHCTRSYAPPFTNVCRAAFTPHHGFARSHAPLRAYVLPSPAVFTRLFAPHRFVAVWLPTRTVYATVCAGWRTPTPCFCVPLRTFTWTLAAHRFLLPRRVCARLVLFGFQISFVRFLPPEPKPGHNRSIVATPHAFRLTRPCAWTHRSAIALAVCRSSFSAPLRPVLDAPTRRTHVLNQAARFLAVFTRSRVHRLVRCLGWFGSPFAALPRSAPNVVCALLHARAPHFAYIITRLVL